MSVWGHRWSGRRLALTSLAVLLLVVGAGFLLVPAEAHGFPNGIPVTCGGPYRLLTGGWLATGTEGGVEFTATMRSQWQKECTEQALLQVVIGVVLLVAGTLLYRRRKGSSSAASASL